MMTSHCDFNPALGTNWFTEKNGKVFLFKIHGTHCRGFGDKFEITDYELKYAYKEQPQLISAAEFLKMIAFGVVKPDWSAEGSLFDEE